MVEICSTRSHGVANVLFPWLFVPRFGQGLKARLCLWLSVCLRCVWTYANALRAHLLIFGERYWNIAERQTTGCEAWIAFVNDGQKEDYNITHWRRTQQTGIDSILHLSTRCVWITVSGTIWTAAPLVNYCKVDKNYLVHCSKLSLTVVF